MRAAGLLFGGASAAPSSERGFAGQGRPEHESVSNQGCESVSIGRPDEFIIDVGLFEFGEGLLVDETAEFSRSSSELRKHTPLRNATDFVSVSSVTSSLIFLAASAADRLGRVLSQGGGGPN